ncbi:MAG: class I poly(R)-hydroxyalkanoic acid synthase [Bacteroidota bacterium]
MSNSNSHSATFDINDLIKTNEKVAKYLVENSKGIIHDEKDLTRTYLHFAIKIFTSEKEIFKIQKNYFWLIQNQQELWKRLWTGGWEKESPIITPEKNDKRFNAPEWNETYFDFLKQNYLLISQMFSNIINELDLDKYRKRKLNFYSRQYLDALSPSNFLITNPEALKRAKETKGESIIDGFKNLMHDIQHQRITQSDDITFSVGVNLATTKGAVVYRNELIEIIQYAPLTKDVHSIPLLIIPPWINKYYILDLQKNNSFIGYAVAQGFTVFAISWKNPTSEMGHLKFDDYVEKGVLNGIEVVRKITGAEKVNTLGYCIGGTILGIALAILSARKQDVVNSATFLASMLDFTDIGPMGDVIEEALVRKLERGDILQGGVMPGRTMEKAFNLIRDKDLIWYYVVNNYLEGKRPPPFDVMEWTNDNTNLPAGMYLFYMRQLVLENKLSKRNAINICGVPINLFKIKTPTFVIGMKEDHISPAKTTFTTTEILKGPIEYLLGESGHIMGVVNPPSKNKYGYRLGGILNEGYDEWKRTATSHEGSWWIPWRNWLEKKSGKLITSKKQLGNAEFPELIPAPGSYVFEKCCEEK